MQSKNTNKTLLKGSFELSFKTLYIIHRLKSRIDVIPYRRCLIIEARFIVAGTCFWIN